MNSFDSSHADYSHNRFMVLMTPETLVQAYYFCAYHSGMGGQITAAYHGPVVTLQGPVVTLQRVRVGARWIHRLFHLPSSLIECVRADACVVRELTRLPLPIARQRQRLSTGRSVRGRTLLRWGRAASRGRHTTTQRACFAVGTRATAHMTSAHRRAHTAVLQATPTQIKSCGTPPL